MANTEKESDIQASICDYLALKQRCFWRSNNMPVFNRGNEGQITMRRLPKYTPRGLPDINVVAGGQYWGLEVKTKVGRVSPEQKEMGDRIRKHGGRYEVVRSLDEVIALGL